MTYLFSLTIFLSAFLLFLIQPLVAKTFLPILGGTPAVWNACMLTFQLLLLLGYAYAHCLRKISKNKNVLKILHLGIFLLCYLFASFQLIPNTLLGDISSPALWLIQRTLLTVGPLFFILSSSSPLLQDWFSESNTNPYPLYVASNLGSLIALLSYPLLIEPLWTVEEQSKGISMLAVLCGFLIASCALKVRTASSEARSIEPKSVTAPPSVSKLLSWCFLSFIPSSLMLGLTTHVTTNVAAVPLFWVIPLACYLITFILAFQEKPLISSEALSSSLPMILILFAPLPFYDLNITPIATTLVQLFFFTIIALHCHSRLSATKPDASQLTLFYLVISVGGALGGLFNSLLAPNIFNSIIEYPVIIALAAWSRNESEFDNENRLPTFAIVLSILSLAWVYCAYFLNFSFNSVAELALIYGIPAFLIFSLKAHPKLFALCFSLLFISLGLRESKVDGEVQFRTRNFFGAKSVVTSTERNLRFLKHGTINHGSQSILIEHVLEPLSYFTTSGPVGDIFSLFSSESLDEKVAVLGLGIGAMACYAKSGEHFTFFELDPLVEKLAKETQYFTYLHKCLGFYKIVLGDGRLTLSQEKDHQFKLIFLDAFSSDAVPVHLLTREAIAMYLSKLTDDGILVFNISNQFIDFRPLLAAQASEFHLQALFRDDTNISKEDYQRGKLASIFMVLSRNSALMNRLQSEMHWKKQESQIENVWTDKFSNILNIMKF